jgi:hypothetical protein
MAKRKTPCCHCHHAGLRRLLQTVRVAAQFTVAECKHEGSCSSTATEVAAAAAAAAATTEAAAAMN